MVLVSGSISDTRLYTSTINRNLSSMKESCWEDSIRCIGTSKVMEGRERDHRS